MNSNPFVVPTWTWPEDQLQTMAKLPHDGERLSTDTDAGKQALADLKIALKGSTQGGANSTSQLQFA